VPFVQSGDVTFIGQLERSSLLVSTPTVPFVCQGMFFPSDIFPDPGCRASFGAASSLRIPGVCPASRLHLFSVVVVS